MASNLKALAGYPYDTALAARQLARKDPRLGAFMRRHGPYDQKLRREADLFRSLARAIAYQQLSGKAAATIHGRFEALFPHKPCAGDCQAMSHQQLRDVGLSNAKALAIRDLADKVQAGALPSRRKILRMPDDEVLDALVSVRGIGPWTAQMYLMFNLGRPDVMPADDLGVQKGLQVLLELPEKPDAKALAAHAERWAPYRSMAAWYLWRAADTVLM